MYIFGLLYACAKLSILLCFPHIALAVTIVNLLWIGRDGKRMAAYGHAKHRVCLRSSCEYAECDNCCSGTVEKIKQARNLVNNRSLTEQSSVRLLLLTRLRIPFQKQKLRRTNRPYCTQQ